MHKKTVSLSAILLILAGVGCVIVLYLGREVLWPFILAVLLVYILSPVVDFLIERRLPRLLAVACVFLMLLAAFVGLALLIIPGLVGMVQDIAEELPQYGDRLREYSGIVRDYYERLGIPVPWEELTNQLYGAVRALVENIVNGVLKAFSFAFLSILSLIVAFYLLKDGHKVKNALVRHVPAAYQETVGGLLDEFDHILGSYIRAQAIIALIVGASICVGLLIMGIPYAIFLGSLAGVLNVIPYLGPIIAIIPTLFLALFRDPFSGWILLWIILLFIGVNQAEGYFLAPHIIGRRVNLHPVVVMFAMIVGGAVMGISGVLLAIPVVAMIKAVLRRLNQDAKAA